MPPKSKKDNFDNPPESLADVVNLLAGIKSSIDTLDSNFETLNLKLEKLNERVERQESSYSEIKSEINYLEQRGRNNSLRLFGLKIDETTAKCAMKTSKFVYKNILHPILCKAVEEKDISQIPDALSLIEYCYVLPAPKNHPSSTPIIVRLHSRLIHLLIFRYKRDFFSSNKDLKGCFITEDLTSQTCCQLNELKAKENTLKAWTLNGRIKFTTKDSPDQVKNY